MKSLLSKHTDCPGTRDIGIRLNFRPIVNILVLFMRSGSDPHHRHRRCLPSDLERSSFFVLGSNQADTADGMGTFAHTQ